MAADATRLTLIVDLTDKATAQMRAIGQAVAQETEKAKRSVEDLGTSTQRSAERQKTSTGAVSTAYGEFRSRLIMTSAALSGAASLASILARGNDDLRKSLQTASLALSAGSAVLSTFGNVLRAVIAVVGAKVAAIAVLVGAIVWLTRNWDQAIATARQLWQNFATFLTRLWGAIVETARGLGEIIAGVFTIKPERIMAGIEQFRTGLGQIGAIARDVGGQAITVLGAVWDKTTQAFDVGAKKATASVGALAKATKEATAGVVVALTAIQTAFQLQRAGERNAAEMIARNFWELNAAIKAVGDTMSRTDWGGPARIWRSHWDEAEGAADDVFSILVKGFAQTMDLVTAFTLVSQAMARARERGISVAEALVQIQKNAAAAGVAAAAAADLASRHLEQTRERAQRVAQAVGAIGVTFDKMSARAQTALAGMSTSIGQAVGQWVVGISSFGDFVQSVWRAIQQAFANIVAEMVAEWLRGLLRMRAIQAAFGFLGGIFGGIFGFIGRLFGLQQGGIITGPTPALLHGGEAVIPLTQLPSLVPGLGGGGGLSVNFNGLTLMDEISAWKLSRLVAEEVRRQQRRTMPTPARTGSERSAAGAMRGAISGINTYWSRVAR